MLRVTRNCLEFISIKPNLSNRLFGLTSLAGDLFGLDPIQVDAINTYMANCILVSSQLTWTALEDMHAVIKNSCRLI